MKKDSELLIYVVATDPEVRILAAQLIHAIAKNAIIKHISNTSELQRKVDQGKEIPDVIVGTVAGGYDGGDKDTTNNARSWQRLLIQSENARLAEYIFITENRKLLAQTGKITGVKVDRTVGEPLNLNSRGFSIAMLSLFSE